MIKKRMPHQDKGKIFRKFFFSLIFLLSIASYLLPPAHALIVPTTPSTKGLVLYWRLDEGETNKTRDYSENNLTGTLASMADPATAISGWTTSGKIGGAVVFDGNNDAVTVADNDKLDIRTGSMTWSVWFQTSTTSRGIIYRKSDATNTNGVILEIGSVSAGLTDCFLHSGGSVPLVTSSKKYNDGQWHHMACVLNRTTAIGSLYMDGNIVATTSVSALAGIDMNSSQAGGLSALPFFDGTLDDFRIYNRVLSTSEVSSLAKSPTVSGMVTTNGTSLGTGLQLYYSFDGKDTSSSTVTDKSGNGNVGVFFNGPVQTQGKIGQGLKLKSSPTQYINAGTSTFGITNQLTISVWIRPATASTIGQIISNSRDCCGLYQGFGFGYHPSYGGLNFMYWDTTNTRFTLSTSGYTPPSNTWTHVAVTFDSGSTKIYVNGSLKNSGLLNGTGIISTPFSSSTMIGRLGENASFPYDGALDELRVYNRPLSVSEIKQLYNQGQTAVNSSLPSSASTGAGNGLLGHWTFDGKTLTNATATDSSVNGNAGTLVGSPVPAIGKVGQGMSFNGTSQYVQVPFSSSLAPTTSVLSFGTWFKATDKIGGKRIISKTQTGGYNLAFNDVATNTISAVIFLPNTGGYRSVTYSLDNIKLNTWYHAFATYDGSLIRFYINGSLVATTTGSGPISYSVNNTLCIGNEAGNIGCTDGVYFAGSIDDVRVYNRWLSSTEVLQLYKLGGR